MQPLQQRFEFREAFRRLFRIVGADIEVILDRVRAAGQALEKIGIIGRFADLRVGGGCGLLEHARKPEMGETHLAQFGQERVVEILEFSAAILRDGAAGFARFIHIPEKPGHQLINAHAFRAEPGVPCDVTCFDVDLEKTAHVLVSDPFAGPGVRAREQTAPPLIFAHVLGIDGQAHPRLFAKIRHRNRKAHFARRRLDAKLRRRFRAPNRPLPITHDARVVPSAPMAAR